MKITVTTPSGHIGNQLSSILLDRGAELTVIARHPEKIKHLVDRGAAVIRGEHSDASVVSEAIRGADALFWVMPPVYTSKDPLGDARRFAHAGAKAIQSNPDVRVVQVSSIGAHRPSGTGPIAGVHDTEEIFRSAAKNFIALRPNYFMENIFNSLPTIVTDGNLYTSAQGSVTAPQIATQDIAEIAADILLSPAEGQRVVDIVGPEDFSFNRGAEIISQALGKTVRVVTIPPDKLVVGLRQAGISPQMADLFVEMEDSFKEIAHEFLGDEKRTGRITYAQFIKDVFVPAYKQASASVA